MPDYTWWGINYSLAYTVLAPIGFKRFAWFSPNPITLSNTDMHATLCTIIFSISTYQNIIGKGLSEWAIFPEIHLTCACKILWLHLGLWIFVPEWCNCWCNITLWRTWWSKFYWKFCPTQLYFFCLFNSYFYF